MRRMVAWVKRNPWDSRRPALPPRPGAHPGQHLPVPGLPGHALPPGGQPGFDAIGRRRHLGLVGVRAGRPAAHLPAFPARDDERPPAAGHLRGGGGHLLQPDDVPADDAVLWWMVRRLFGLAPGLLLGLLLLIPYTFFWQTAVTSAAALVLVLTPLIFLSLERKRWVTPAILLAVCLYTHLVMGHLVALALFIYLLHRRESGSAILKVLAAAYILYLPWGHQHRPALLELLHHGSGRRRLRRPPLHLAGRPRWPCPSATSRRAAITCWPRTS